MRLRQSNARHSGFERQERKRAAGTAGRDMGWQDANRDNLTPSSRSGGLPSEEARARLNRSNFTAPLPADWREIRDGDPDRRWERYAEWTAA